MAIIRLDCNLNGGDSVTPNNELFYRIYGDVDAYASPIHTTGTALSDANVTVNNDNVIITGVDGDTNTTFKIAAVDAAFNEGVLSDAAVESSILFEDDFAGVVIDTAKWNLVNPDADAVYTQDGQMEMTYTGEIVAKSNYLESQSAYTGIVTYAFDILKTPYVPNSQWACAVVDDIATADNRIYVAKSSSSYVQIVITIGSSILLNETVALDVTSVQSIKVVDNGTDIRVFYHNGSSWVQLSTTQVGTLQAVAMKGYIYAWTLTSDAVPIIVDNFVITDADYSTLRP